MVDKEDKIKDGRRRSKEANKEKRRWRSGGDGGDFSSDVFSRMPTTSSELSKLRSNERRAYRVDKSATHTVMLHRAGVSVQFGLHCPGTTT